MKIPIKTSSIAGPTRSKVWSTGPVSAYIATSACFVLCILSLFSGCTSSVDSKPKKPNLIFVLSDQHSYDMLGSYGNQQIKTPNLDQFAAEGIRFTNCFSNSPLCTPFRGMVMSGQHPLYNGCYTNDVPLIPGNGKKFGEVLRDEGYSTAYIGKWHLLGGERDRPIPHGEMRYGFDETFRSNNCHVDFRPGKAFSWNEEGEKEHFDEWEVYGQTQQALSFLDQQQSGDHPFALFVSWHPPHDWGKFKGEDGKMHYRYETLDELMALYDRDSIKVRPGMESSPDLRRMYHGHMAMVSGVDQAFGQLMEKLDEIGATENTLVVFSADHGDMLEFENAVFPKSYPHDYSLHIPLLMRMPGQLPAGATSSLLTGALDLMPSTLGLMGLQVPPESHGKNLADAIVQGDEDAVDFVPIWMFVRKGWRGVITKNHSFAIQQEGATQGSLHNVLFDRKSDPYQLQNRLGDPDLVAEQAKLWQLTQSWMATYNDQFYRQEDFLSVQSWEEWHVAPFERPVDLFQGYNK